jgi:hypothetical protein
MWIGIAEAIQIEKSNGYQGILAVAQHKNALAAAAGANARMAAAHQ